MLWCWGLWGCFLSFGCAGVGIGAGIIAGSLWWGPGAHSSSSLVPAIIHLPYPTCKQVLAVVGMGGGLVFSVLGGLSVLVTVACLWGSLGAYRVGIPLLGSPSIPLHPPSLCQQPHIPFEQGGELGGCGCALHVFCHCRLSLVEYNLTIKKK